MASTDKSGIMMHRAEALAYVTLTRIAHLTPVRLDYGHIDFLADISNEQQLQIFGVIVKAARAIDSVKAANTYGRSINSHPYYFPTVVLLFSMEDETGYVAWHTEPDAPAPSTILHRHTQLDFHVCDNDELESIVSKVKSWYKSFAQV